MTVKKTTTRPRPKPKAVIIPPNPTRVYGATVFSVVTDDRPKAANLVGSHGFRVSSEDADGWHLYADAVAYKSYKAG